MRRHLLRADPICCLKCFEVVSGNNRADLWVFAVHVEAFARVMNTQMLLMPLQRHFSCRDAIIKLRGKPFEVAEVLQLDVSICIK